MKFTQIYDPLKLLFYLFFCDEYFRSATVAIENGGLSIATLPKGHVSRQRMMHWSLSRARVGVEAES